MDKVNIVFFSGTGGTARIAGLFNKAFLERNIRTSMTELNKKQYPDIDGDMLLVLYPVYAMNAPKPVFEWISQVQNCSGINAAIIAVSGGGEMSPNTACRVDVKRKLARKGCNVCYEDMLVMPSNVFVSYDDILSVMIMNAAPVKVERIVNALVAQKKRLTKPLIPDYLFAKFSIIEIQMSKIFGKNLRAEDNCTGCSWCVQNCPMGNISIKGKRPVFGSKCVICLKCIYGCPNKAVKIGIGKFIAVKGGYNLDALERKACDIREFPPVSEVAKGYLLSGVRKYLDDN